MPRLSRFARCVAVSLLAVPLATSAFASSPSKPGTTSITMPAQKAGGPYTHNPLTAGPMLPFNPGSFGRLPFGAMAGPQKVQVPGVPAGPTKVAPPATTGRGDIESLDRLIAGSRVKF